MVIFDYFAHMMKTTCNKISMRKDIDLFNFNIVKRCCEEISAWNFSKKIE